MPSPEVFADRLAFALDDFQLDGLRALERGTSVLVAAPTGAGKTVVGEYAVWRALQRDRKCFYTTPIKALSNQKYDELCEVYGIDRVGLLTGDRSIRGDAPVVVMTTEVLRNMLYEASPTLAGLEAVVLDEVHYLADRERGAVWEEVIVQLPAGVQLACLSATVSNAEEFGAWLDWVRGAALADAGEDPAPQGCEVVISDRRPVPLDYHYAFNDRLEPVFRAGGKHSGRKPKHAKIEAAKQGKGGVPNPDIVMLERQQSGGRRGRRGGRAPGGTRVRPPRRSALVQTLAERHWLPAIVFVFSRQGCDAAVGQLVSDGLSLTSEEERASIRSVVDERVAELSADDLGVLGFGPWLAGLERGIAAHHAGMVPAFKEAVEELFVRGLLRVCFATETLALGINMPARTVVIERLEKWDGQQHALLTSGQFTQLTGRAGRRGLDKRGHAVVMHQTDVDFATVASLVGRRVEPLRSRFTPSYNMAVNMLRRHDRATAESLLARSFAQWQTDAGVADDSERLARNRRALAGYAENLVSSRGDFAEYWSLRRMLSRVEGQGAKRRRNARANAVHEGLAALAPGDVVAVDDDEVVAVVGGHRTKSGIPIAQVVTPDHKLTRIGPRELDQPPQKVGQVSLPDAGGPRQAAYRKEVANALRRVEVPVRSRWRGPSEAADSTSTVEAARLREQVRAHPVHADPELPEIEEWAHRHDRLAEDTAKLEEQISRRTGSLVARFDRIVDILTELGYLEGDASAPAPTGRGRQLAGLYAETDLLVAQCLRRGVLAGLDAPDLAAVASSFTYEARQKDPPEPVAPTTRVAERLDAAQSEWERLAAREEDANLPATRPPDAGFAEIAWRWTSGAELDDALAGSVMTAGDFVRNIKQTADLLRQLRDVAEDPELEAMAQQAQRRMVRGVVAHAGL